MRNRQSPREVASMDREILHEAGGDRGKLRTVGN
jgi:hypothetical protein